MDKWQAQDAFWNSFGIPAYDQYTVPRQVKEPYITYEAFASGMGFSRTVTAKIYYRSSGWREVSTKADEIAQYIKNLPPAEPIFGGRLKIRIPEYVDFAQRGGDPDPDVRCMIISVDMEFLTEV